MAVAALVIACPAWAGDTVLRSVVPAWVKDVTLEPVVTGDGAPYRYRLLDQQYRFDGETNQTFVRYRVQALAPQGLAAVSAVAMVWSPAIQDLTVHHVLIRRGDQTIDVLANQSFEVLRRERRLEEALLDGVLSATLQPSGLRVGDELEVAYTVATQETVLARHAEAMISGQVEFPVDRLHVVAGWPISSGVQWKATDDWSASLSRASDGFTYVTIDERALEPKIGIPHAPSRYNVGYLLELTDYQSWSELSRTIAPIFQKASVLEPGSPLTTEIARIAAASNDPVVRAEMALRLVQDDIRYLALAMGEAAITPATADETWRQRFGDCKGKTAVLIALLQGLGIEAVPVLVNTKAGDAVPDRLPAAAVMDHVLVRATIDGRTYWLDGTKTGDRALNRLVPPAFRWALPLVTEGAELQAIEAPPLTFVQTETSITVDASAGVYAPASIRGEAVMSGDVALAMQHALQALSAEERERLLKAMWTVEMPEMTVERVSSDFDEELARLRVTGFGTATFDWSEDGLEAPGTRVGSMLRRRSEEPPSATPYALAHPIATRSRVTVKLPNWGEGFEVGPDIILDTPAYAVRRVVTRSDAEVAVDLSLTSLRPELSADEVGASIDLLKGDVSRYFRIRLPRDYQVTAGDRAAWAAEGTGDAQAMVIRALALVAAGQRREALELLDQAVSLAPDDANVLANRALERVRSGNLEGARADLAKAVELDPTERIAMNGNALLAMYEGDFRDTVIEITRALRQAPKDPFGLGLRAGAYAELGDYTRALADADVLVEVTSGDEYALGMRAAILRRAARWPEALQAVDALVGAAPDNLGYLAMKASITAEAGDAPGAMALFDQLVARDPDNLDWLLARIEFRLDQSMLVEAEGDLALFRQEVTTVPHQLNNLCWALGRRRLALEAALDDCERAVELEPENVAYQDSLAMVLLQMGRYQEAHAIYERASAAPDQAISLYGLGLAKIALGQKVEGEARKVAALTANAKAAEPYAVYEAAIPSQ